MKIERHTKNGTFSLDLEKQNQQLIDAEKIKYFKENPEAIGHEDKVKFTVYGRGVITDNSGLPKEVKDKIKIRKAKSKKR